jgi:hypothetical protein
LFLSFKLYILKMKSIFAALAAIAVSVVSAQTIVSSQPTTDQVLVAGTTAQIVWAPVAGTISTIDLRSGSASALVLVQNVATNVDASTGSYAWAVPATLTAATDCKYFVFSSIQKVLWVKSV